MPQRVEGSVEIEVSAQTAYDYWQSLENLPYFMKNVEQVRSTGPDTTHWRMKGPFGTPVEFEARTTQKESGQAIGWNTIEGDVGSSGQVSFTEATPNRSRVDVVMNYSDPPGGRAGEAAAKVLADPHQMLEQDLINLKDILEGKASPEEVQQRPSAATVQSGVIAFLTSGAGLALLGVSGLVLVLVRLRGGARAETEPRKFRIVLEF